MIFFHIQGLYNVASLVFSWFALANLWLTFSIIIDFLPAQNPPILPFGTITVVSSRNPNILSISAKDLSTDALGALSFQVAISCFPCSSIRPCSG